MLHTAIEGIRGLLQPYRIMMGFGVLAGVLVLLYNGAPAGKRARAWRLGAFALSLGLGYFACSAANWFIHSLWRTDPGVRVDQAGMSGYPGLLAAMGLYALLTKREGMPARDAAAPAYALAHGFMRIGCAFGGCCYGIEMGWPAFGGRVPTQLIEVAFVFALFCALEFRVKARRMSAYLIAYAAFRFAIEFLRADDRGVLIALLPGSPAQQMAVITGAAAMAVRCFQRRQAVKE